MGVQVVATRPPAQASAPTLRYGSRPRRCPAGAPVPMPTLTAEALLSHLQQLLRQVRAPAARSTPAGPSDDRLIVASRDYYMIFSAQPGDPAVQVEAVSNFYLPAAAALTPGRLGQLSQRGYRERPNRNNLYRTVTPQDDAALHSLAAEVLEVFGKAYGIDAGSPAEFDLQHGPAESVRNPDLIKLMRTLSLKRDWDARRALYSALLGSIMLVPIDPVLLASEDVVEPIEVDRLGKFPVIAAFTDIDSLRLWQPRGAPYRALPVTEIVPQAVARRVGSLLINPKGVVGGELYINELESMNDALKRRAALA